MTSSRLLSKFAALSLLALLAVPAFADKNDDLYNKATAAVNSGDAVAARDAFCAIDPSYKDAAQNCTTYKGEATRQLNRYNQNFIDGQALLQQGKFDEAAVKFRNVKAGSYVDLAKQQLDQIPKLKQDAANKVAADQAAQQSAAADSAAQGKLNDATAAFNRGDYAAARSALSGVGGKYAGQAQDLLGRITAAESSKASAQSQPTKPAVREPEK